MQRRLFAGFFLVSLLIAGSRGGQNSSDNERPVWTMEIIKAKPEMFGFTLGYLDDNWMRVREEAKRQGAVLNYHRIAEQSDRENDRNIVLLTEYKNSVAYDAREKLFDSIRKQLPNKSAGIVRIPKPEDLYETLSTRVFQDYSDAGDARLRLLAKD